MPDPALYDLFVLAALALLAVPGPAVLYVVAARFEGGLGPTAAFAGSRRTQ